MLKLVIPPRSKEEYFNSETNEFYLDGEDFGGMTIQLEHSLISISKWESKWHVPYLSRNEKTNEQIIDYIKDMTITKNVPDIAYRCLTKENLEDVIKYINDPMTATTIKSNNKSGGREIVTSELVYYWMILFQIPMECERWHFNRLMVLIEVCGSKNGPQKKMSQREIMQQNVAINAARRAKHHSKG